MASIVHSQADVTIDPVATDAARIATECDAKPARYRTALVTVFANTRMREAGEVERARRALQRLGSR